MPIHNNKPSAIAVIDSKANKSSKNKVTRFLLPENPSDCSKKETAKEKSENYLAFTNESNTTNSISNGSNIIQEPQTTHPISQIENENLDKNIKLPKDANSSIFYDPRPFEPIMFNYFSTKSSNSFFKTSPISTYMDFPSTESITNKYDYLNQNLIFSENSCTNRPSLFFNKDLLVKKPEKHENCIVFSQSFRHKPSEKYLNI
jgi:hypothetical protein